MTGRATRGPSMLRLFRVPAERSWRWTIASASIVSGSLVTLVPVVATAPVLPPFGLLMLLAWRLRRNDAFRSWAPVPLGLFDDLVSGAPLGSAMALWTFCVLAIDLIDSRLVWRTFRQDWAIAAIACLSCLSLGRLFAAPLRAHVDLPVLLQAGATIALFPLTARIVARIDEARR